jgi:hypothetical protein
MPDHEQKPADLYVADPPFARWKEAWHDAGTYDTEIPRFMVAACMLGYGWIVDLGRLVRRR